MSGGDKTMESIKQERQWFTWLMLAAALFGCLGFATSNINILYLEISAHAMNLPNMLFTLFRLIPIVLPVSLIFGGNRFMAKILRTKIILGLWAACCLFGILWALYFISDESLYELFDFDKIFKYQTSVGRLFVGNYILWGTYRLSGTVFSIILFGLMCANATVHHMHRLVSAAAFTAIFALYLLAPLAVRLIVYHSFYTVTWLGNNALFILSSACLTAGIWVAARSDTAWLELIWGESAPDYMSDEYEEE